MTALFKIKKLGDDLLLWKLRPSGSLREPTPQGGSIISARGRVFNEDETSVFGPRATRAKALAPLLARKIFSCATP